MVTQQHTRSVSRRAALAGLGMSGITLALATTARPTAAQEGAGNLAGHPIVGTWAVMAPDGVIPQIHGPDGSVVVAYPPNFVDPMLGLTFHGPGLGRWEADDERNCHFAAIQALSDANGAFIGTLLFEAGIEVSADGQTWVGGGSTPLRIIVRDAANNVTFDQVLSGGPPVTATRIGATVESVILPVATTCGRHAGVMTRCTTDQAERTTRMSTQRSAASISRRTALAGLGMSGIALAAGGHTASAAQNASLTAAASYAFRHDLA